jgi:hypothetical protein
MELAEQALNDLFSNRVKSLDQKDREAVIHLANKLIGQSSFGPIRKLSSRLINERSEMSLADFDKTFGKAV